MKINIKNEIGKSVILRTSINDLNKYILDTDIILDFKDVEFISRASCDELYNLIEKNKNIKIINMCENVQTMYDIVCVNRKEKNNLKINKKSNIIYVYTLEDLNRICSEF